MKAKVPLRVLRLLLALTLASIVAGRAAAAQGEGDPDRGSRGPIDVAGLVQLLDAGDWIDGYLVRGRDLIDAMARARPDAGLRIRNAVIVGPLELTQALPQAHLFELDEADSPDAIESVWLRGGYSHRLPIRVMDRQVLIDSSSLLSWSAAQGDPSTRDLAGERPTGPPEVAERSIDAEQVLFRKGLFLTRSRVVGVVRAPGAVFPGQSTFWDTAFEGDVDFDAVAFLTMKRSTLSYIPQFYNLRPFPGRPYGFDRARVGGAASFKSAFFRSAAGFRSASFDGPVTWVEAEFAQGADFTASAFKGVADFSKARVAGPARFEEAAFGGAPGFAETQFEGPAHFQRAVFAAVADFSGASFTDTADFASSRFQATASFNGSTFPKAAVFERSEFGGPAHFENATFQEAARFRWARFDDRVKLNDARFLQGGEFRDAVFRSQISAVLTEFASDTSFAGAVFEDSALFDLSRFEGRVSLASTRFLGPMSFRGVNFDGALTVRNLALEAYGDFRGTSIDNLSFESSPQPSLVAGRLDFRSADIGTLCLSDVTFLDQVDFSDATLGRPGSMPPEPCGRITEIAALRDGKAGVEDPWEVRATVDFVSVTFADDVFFIRTRFQGAVKFEQLRANALADFTGASLRDVESFTLSFSEFRDPDLSMRQLPDAARWRRVKGLQPLSEAFAELEGRFRALGQVDDANAAHFHAKRGRLYELRAAMAASEGQAWQSPAFEDWLAAEADWWFWGLLSGYGTKLWWCVGWAAALTLLFALAFVFFGRLRLHPSTSPEEDEARSAISQRLLDWPKDFLCSDASFPEIEGWRSRLVVALRLSGAVLLKVGPRNVFLDSDGRHWVPLLLRLQWALGYYVVAALIFTLSETWPLLNRLLAGIF